MGCGGWNLKTEAKTKSEHQNLRNAGKNRLLIGKEKISKTVKHTPSMEKTMARGPTVFVVGPVFWCFWKGGEAEGNLTTKLWGRGWGIKGVVFVGGVVL